ncbi:hypothetical protein Taro_024196, partial [Colocasia esculenta]|nr:hypothetical protein [Colocasia esculenta]
LEPRKKVDGGHFTWTEHGKRTVEHAGTTWSSFLWRLPRAQPYTPRGVVGLASDTLPLRGQLQPEGGGSDALISQFLSAMDQ